jgi:lipoprotein-anchoring transpeptidase ErfK/SrfK
VVGSIASVPRRIALLAVASVVILAACGGGSSNKAAAPTTVAPTTTAAPTTTTAPVSDTSWVAKANKDLSGVDVFATSDLTAAPTQTIAQPNEDGAPLAFLLKGAYDPAAAPAAIEVYLPVRPNGSSGFIRSSDVTVFSHQFKITVQVGAHHILVTKAGAVVLDAPVGIGTSDTPTPGGIFYIKELLKVPNPNGPYGPYAYGLSGFSDVLTDFAGGTGVIGIHGTNDPSTIGTDVSHGCIRMSNDNITMLAKILPVGTPVDIQP